MDLNILLMQILLQNVLLKFIERVAKKSIYMRSVNESFLNKEIQNS